jgi:hypothetical protein
MRAAAGTIQTPADALSMIRSPHRAATETPIWANSGERLRQKPGFLNRIIHLQDRGSRNK